MWRRLFTFCAAVSLLLCAAVCVLWVARVQHRRVVNGWLFRGSRYSLVLSPDQVAILGPPPPPTPAPGKSIGEIDAMRASGGTLRYHGTTGAMGFRDWDFFNDAPHAGAESVFDQFASAFHRPLSDASIPVLMAALEDERFFLVAHAMLTETTAGEIASDNPRESSGTRWSRRPKGPVIGGSPMTASGSSSSRTGPAGTRALGATRYGPWRRHPG